MAGGRQSTSPGQPTLKARHASWKLRVRDAACLQVWPTSIQVESFRQHIKRVAHYLLGVLAKLPIKIGIVMRSDAALESSRIGRSIEEPRRDTQCANSITGSPRSTNFVGLGVHLLAPRCNRVLLEGYWRTPVLLAERRSVGRRYRCGAAIQAQGCRGHAK